MAPYSDATVEPAQRPARRMEIPPWPWFSAKAVRYPAPQATVAGIDARVEKRSMSVLASARFEACLRVPVTAHEARTSLGPVGDANSFGETHKRTSVNREAV